MSIAPVFLSSSSRIFIFSNCSSVQCCVIQFLTALLALSARLLSSSFSNHESQITKQNEGMPKAQTVKFSLQGKAPVNSVRAVLFVMDLT